MFSFHETQKAIIDSYEYALVNTAFSRSIASAQYKSGTSSLSISYRTNQLECLLMNNSAPELTKEVRQAIRSVVDTSKIISNVYSGLATAANLPFYPGTWMYNDSLSSYFQLNQEEARRLLEDAGWGDADEDGILDKLNSEGKQVNLHLRFYVYEEPENDVRVEAANQIADMLAAVGIDHHRGSDDAAQSEGTAERGLLRPGAGFLRHGCGTGSRIHADAGKLRQLYPLPQRGNHRAV